MQLDELDGGGRKGTPGGVHDAAGHGVAGQGEEEGERNGHG